MNLFKVFLLGTGGYGESVIVEMCEHNWIVIDSCINPYNKECLPLLYLKEKGVDIKNDVKLIICSHWHNDHIRGLDVLLKACNSAKFVLPIASDQEKFLEFVGLDSRKEKVDTFSSSTDILKKCIDIQNTRNGEFLLSNQDKLLLELTEKNIKYEIHSLTPSDAIIKEFGKELSTLMTDFCNSNVKIPFKSPNEKCTVILVTVNNHSIILGSDLENSHLNDRGWLCILDKCQAIHNKKVSLLKIPHHGSVNAFEERLWNEVICENKVGMITPFIHGNVCLPTKEMMGKYLNITNHLYITSNKMKSKHKDRTKSLNKAICNIRPSIQEVNFAFGVICSCIDSDNDKALWNTTCERSAVEISQSMIDSYLTTAY